MQNSATRSARTPFFLTTLLVAGIAACQSPPPAEAPVTRRAGPDDFADTAAVTVQLADGLRLDLWAPTALLASPVAVSFDNQGVAYVTETTRRKTSDLDIRAHTDWMAEDLALESLDDTEAFLHRKLDPALSDQNDWQQDFNGDGRHDWRDLGVQSERIHRVWDSDGDGRADASIVFAEDFNSILTGVAAGVLYHEGDVFAAVNPDLWRLRDRDGDGTADERTAISRGYGLHIGFAGHDMSGLTVGPDGKLYWSIGDLGVNVTGPDGREWVYAHQGAVMRANPDGSDFEVYAAGLRNPQELAFDAHGNLISVDNDGDYPGEHERVVHILEGSDSGWRTYWQFGKYDQPDGGYNVWTGERLHLPYFEGQAAYLLPPIALAQDGPAGFAFNPGTALGPGWEDHFFSSYFTGSPANARLHAFRLEPDGASFSVVDDREILRGILATGITFGPDGALYLADWIEGWDIKPTGRIWRLDVAPGAANPLRDETGRLLAEGMTDRPPEELQDLLRHADMRVRLAAQFELARRDASAPLLDAARQTEHQLARLHGIWGLGQLMRSGSDEPAEPLFALLDDADAEIRAHAARVLGETRYEPAVDKLIALLGDARPRVQLYAAEALGKLEDGRAFLPLVALLAALEMADTHLRHAATYALARLGDQAALADLAQHPSRTVRLSAVVALRRLHAPGVARFLEDRDPLVVTETARAIHDDESISAALPALARMLTPGLDADEALLRRVINANLRMGDEANAGRLAAYAAESRSPAAFRAVALQALAAWPMPPVLDRVEGRHRVAAPRQPDAARSALGPVLTDLLENGPQEVRIAAADAVRKLKPAEAEQTVYAMAIDTETPAPVRRAALQALASFKGERLVPALELTLADDDVDVRREAQALLASRNLPDSTLAPLLETVLTHGTIPEQQQALAALGKLRAPRADALLGAWLDDLAAGTVPPELQLDVLMAAEQHSGDEVRDQYDRYVARRGSSDPIAEYRETLYGGDPDRGREVVLRHPAAECMRCHALEDGGGEVGPALVGAGGRLSRGQLLEALVAPGVRLAPGFGTVALTLRNGQTVAGTIQEETDAALSLKLGTGETRAVDKRDIATRQNSPSAMPPMQNLLTPAEIRDVVAFLASLD